MSRLVPYRTKAPELVKERIEQTLATTMYLVQTTGPTSYVIQEQNSEKKCKVLIGALQNCSCGDRDVCVHILFVMLKILRVPATVPVVWQKSLIDSEVEMLLRGDYREQSRAAAAKTVTPFLKKRRDAAAVPQTDAKDPAEAVRHDLVEGEVCAICQEDMDTSQPLTFCRRGCGNNFHIECMKVFGESRKQSKENIVCPLCRQDWGDLALVSLKKEIEVANRAPNVHKHVACKKCQLKPIRHTRYLCVQCKSTNLCERCFKSGVHSKHAFVMKHTTGDSWMPAARASESSERIRPELVDELQSRELSNNDYDLLLQLDQSDCSRIQDYLLASLGGSERVAAADAKTFGAPGAVCWICRQSLRIHADVRSIPCGHAFHESCLARSILSQIYACPHPECDRVLFPGLHYALTKEDKRKSESHEAQSKLPEGRDNKTALPALECAFSVLSLQQRGPPAVQQLQHCSPPSTGRLSNTHKSSHPVRGRADKSEQQKLPPVLGLQSVGLTAASRSASAQAHAAAATVSNQTEPAPQDETQPRVQRKPATSQATVRHRIGTLSEPRSAATALPKSRDIATLPPLTVGSSAASDRMDQAANVRNELQQSEKARLRKQRLQREERTRMRQAFAGATADNQAELSGTFAVACALNVPTSLDAKLLKAEQSRSATQKRTQDERARKREAQLRKHQGLLQQHEQRGAAATSLDLSIRGSH